MSKVSSLEKKKQEKAASENMTPTLAQLINCVLPNPQNPSPVLVRLSTVQLPGRISYQLARVALDVAAAVEPYEAVRKSLCDKYGTLSADKSQYTFEGEALEKFTAEHKETVEAEVILNHKKMPELLDFVQLSPAEALALEWLVGS